MRQVRLSANTVAERVKRLRRDGVEREEFERGLTALPQLVSAMHVTGDYDYELRVVCANSAEFETIIDRLKRDHGVRDLRSRLLLRELPLGPARLLDQRLPD